MSQWSRSTKPSGNVIAPFSDGNQANIFGVDLAEVSSTPGVTAPGWVYKKVIGSRIQYETLVAMKNPPPETNTSTGDDASFKDFLITITTQPSTATVANSNVRTSLTVVATAAPTAANNTLAYQWQSAVNANASYSNLSNSANGLLSNVTTATLTLANVIGLQNVWFRVVVSSANASANIAATSKTSDPANVILLAP